jgi:predicted MFS family arabinose efflux permease
VLGPIAAAVAMLAAFAYVESHVAVRPLMPLTIFRSAQLTWANVIVVLMYAGLFSMFYFLTLYIQQVLHEGALLAGVSFLPTTLLVFTGSTQAPRLIARYGLRTTLTAGMLIATVGLLWLTGITPGGNYLVEVLPGMILAGFGMGTALVTGTVAAMQGVAPTDSGLASGLLNTSRLVGGALGLATLATIAQSRTRADAALGPVRAAVDGYSLAFTIGGLFTLVGAAVALTMLRVRRRADAATGEAEVAELAEVGEVGEIAEIGDVAEVAEVAEVVEVVGAASGEMIEHTFVAYVLRRTEPRSVRGAIWKLRFRGSAFGSQQTSRCIGAIIV